ncbi:MULTISPECIES: hypothetical protein [Herbaspirillum]|uniref:hypothetical protein n=1 Tax=Herbaspirillum TaxID=963 RepID=UPI0011319779|nr:MULTISPECIES: hypothetical protein [Herbaspirillum]
MLAYLQADKLLRMRASSPQLSTNQKRAIGLYKLYGLLMTLVFVALVLGKLGFLVTAISPVLLVMVVTLGCLIFSYAYRLSRSNLLVLRRRPAAPVSPHFPPNAHPEQAERPPRSAPKK